MTDPRLTLGWPRVGGLGSGRGKPNTMVWVNVDPTHNPRLNTLTTNSELDWMYALCLQELRNALNKVINNVIP